MLLTITFLLIISVLLGMLMEKLKLPALLGYMITGICFSPYMADIFQNQNPLFNSLFLTRKDTTDSGFIRMLALFIILYRAGLGLDRVGLKENGMTTISLSIIPCLLETAAVGFCAHYLFQLPAIESAMLGFVMAAVSPAVIVPMMLKLQDKGIGSDKKIPTMILASSTLDDIIAISGFGICLALLSPEYQDNWRSFIFFIPISLVTGGLIGYYLAKPLTFLFKISKAHTAIQVIALLAIAVAFQKIGGMKFSDLGIYTPNIANTTVPFSYLIATMSLGMSLRLFDNEMASNAAKYFQYIWKVAEIALFVLIGAMVNLELAFDAGLIGLIILIAGLLARSIGVVLSTRKSKLNKNEILFCVLAYLPKATVQATIGGLALTLFTNGKIWLYNGAGTGELIITMAAMGILITAPLGAIATRISSTKLLHVPEDTDS